MTMFATFLGLEPDAWSAIAAWTAVLLGVGAAIFAWRQFNEARKLRREQAQPYVVVSAEESFPGAQLLDIVVRNLGTTSAFDVQLDFCPEPKRANNDSLHIPASIPTLVPGQEWRTFWDSAIQRHASELARRHDVRARYKDSRGDEHSTHHVLDWDTFFDRHLVVVKGLHDLAKDIHDIRKAVESWKEGRAGLGVYVRDGDARDAERERRRAQRADE